MKRIFFYSNHREFDYTIGITNKVHGEIEALREMGYEVIFSAYTEAGAGIFNNHNELIYELKHVPNNNTVARFTRRGLLIKCSLNYLKRETKPFDYGYLRFHFFDMKYVRLLRELKKQSAKVIVEAHAYPYRYWNQVMYIPIYIIDVIFENQARKFIDLVAVMGKADNVWGIKTVQIDNGIDVDKYKIRNRVNSDKLRLISVSNEHVGHAYYKVVNGLSDYYKNGNKRDIVINFVGEYMDSTIKLIKEKNLENHFVFFGKKQGAELDEVFNNSDLGLGAFSHRVDDSGSCIKTKEYFARGIPFINGWKEPAFNDSYPYVLRFDTKEESLDFNKIVAFYDNLPDSSIVANDMREFAYHNYTWLEQMKKVFSGD